MSSVVKALLFFGLALFSKITMARDIYVLAVGDQSAANCHALSYGPAAGVYQLGMDGRERPALDPLDWSDCRNGSIWMPLAIRLKQQPGVNKVVLVPVAVAGAKADEWNRGKAAQRLDAVLTLAHRQQIHFDYALWQQGAPDEATAGSSYINELRMLLKRVSLNVSVEKWVIGGGETCEGVAIPQVEEAQAQLARQVVINRFPGPSVTSSDQERRLTVCQLDGAGQEVMAQRWFEAIQKADSMDKHYDSEALISWFKSWGG